MAFVNSVGIHLVRYDLNGVMRWQGIVHVNGRDDSELNRADIGRVKWADSEVRIYLSRGQGAASSILMLRIPNSSIGVGKESYSETI